MKAGLIAEVMDDAIDSALGGPELEEETEAEVDKVLAELALETAVALPSAKARPVRGNWVAWQGLRTQLKGAAPHCAGCACNGMPKDPWVSIEQVEASHLPAFLGDCKPRGAQQRTGTVKSSDAL